MKPADLRLAARCLRREARALKDSHSNGRRWLYLDDADHYAKDDHDQYLDLARKLERLAKEM